MPKDVWSAVDPSTFNDDSLLNTVEVAELFRLSAGRLRNLRSKGLGPRGFKIGKSVRFRLCDVRAWLDAQADPAPVAEQAR